MRVISQSGKYDFPYENIALEWLKDSNSIFAYTETGAPYEVARYSSVEKAEKAMEMCRNNFSNYFMLCSFNSGFFNNCKSVTELENAVKNMTSASVFQFPANEDVEVENEQRK